MGSSVTALRFSSDEFRSTGFSQTSNVSVTMLEPYELDITVLPSFIEEDEEWFFTPERQEGELEADEDIAMGRVSRFSNVEDLIRSLRS